MKENSILNKLTCAISNAAKLEVQYNSNSQQISNGSIITMAVTGTELINYIKKSAKTKSIMTMPNETTTEEKVYKDCCVCTTTTNVRTDAVPSSSSSICMPMSKASYDFLFCPGGALYPVDLLSLVPCSCCKKDNCSECYTMCPKSMTCVKGYISSLITISMLNNNTFKVTSTINMIDIATNQPLVGYTECMITIPC